MDGGQVVRPEELHASKLEKWSATGREAGVKPQAAERLTNQVGRHEARRCTVIDGDSHSNDRRREDREVGGG